jgi:hypothetical protein
MTFNESTIVASNYSLRSYERSGVHYHAEAIASYYRLVYPEQNGQQSPINFKMPDNLQLVSCWFQVVDNPILSAFTVSISVADWSGIEQYSLSMAILPYAKGSFVALELPFIVMRKDLWLAITPDNFTMEKLMIFAKPVHLQPDILGGRY